MPDGSYSASNIQDYNQYIISKHETIPTNHPIHIYISRINNRLVFKIKDEHEPEFETPKTMKSFVSTKKLKDKTKNGEKVPSLKVVEVVLVQCNLVDNQYQQSSKVLYTFTLNKCYTCLLNVKSSNLVFLKTDNTEFDNIAITFTNENGRALEIEDKVNLTLLVQK